MVTKKRLIVSYKNCPEHVLQAIKDIYPQGYGDAIIKVDKPNGDFFHAITVDLEDVSYLVKINVKIDNLTDEEFEKQFGSENENESELGTKNTEDPDNLASLDSGFDD